MPYYGKLTIHVDNAKKLYVTQIKKVTDFYDTEFSKSEVYIHQNNEKFSKTICALLYFKRIYCNTNFSTYISRAKKEHFQSYSGKVLLYLIKVL